MVGKKTSWVFYNLLGYTLCIKYYPMLEVLERWNNGIMEYKTCKKSDLDGFVKNYEFNYRWLSKKGHIQGVIFFQERGHTNSMPSV